MDVAKLQSLWDDYLEAKAQAEKTADVQDGIKAGQAWGAFLRAFEGKPQLRVIAGGRA